MRKQFKMLEHHADAGAQFRQIGFGIVDLDAVENDFAALERLQRVDAFYQCRFSRSRRTAHHHHLALGDAGGAILQRLEPRPVPFVDVADLDHEGLANGQRRCGIEGAGHRMTRYRKSQNNPRPRTDTFRPAAHRSARPCWRRPKNPGSTARKPAKCPGTARWSASAAPAACYGTPAAARHNAWSGYKSGRAPAAPQAVAARSAGCRLA